MKPSTLTRLKSLKLTRTAPTPAARLSLLHLLDQGLQAPAVRAILVNKDFSQDLVSTTTTTTIIIITTSVSVESVRSPRPVRQNHSEGMSRKYFCVRNNFSIPRLSVDDCDLMLTSSSTTSPVKNQDQEQKEEKVKESAPASSCKEPRRRSVSASYSGQALVQSTSSSSNNNYHCNLCQISVNSQSQLAQVCQHVFQMTNY